MLVNNMPEFWRKKEVERGRIITVREVADNLNVSWDAIDRWKKGEVTKRYDDDILNGLCRFFGVPPGPVPFLVYSPDTEEASHEAI